MKGRILLSGLLVLLVALTSMAQEKNRTQAEEGLKEDLRKLQGKWEYTFKDRERKVLVRKVKEIKDETETVTWYLPNGEVAQVNRVDIKLERKGDDRILIYSNWKFLEGPQKGREFPGKNGSFFYKLDGDIWTSVLETGVGEIPWKRVKEKKHD
jgi:hypothetical protein